MRVQFIDEYDSKIIVEYVDATIPNEGEHVVLTDQRGLKVLEEGKRVQAKVKEVVLDYTRDLALVTVVIN